MNDCSLCPSLCVNRIQIVHPTPSPQGGLLAIGEAPGEDEAIIGEGFVGSSGKRLDKVMAEFGIQRSDYGRANICRCRPPNNRRPTTAEKNNCLPLLVDFIASVKPRVLLLVGLTAAKPFFGKAGLLDCIEIAERQDFRFDPGLAHHTLKALSEVHKLELKVIPMPHTSGLSWNRKTPSGESWSAIGRLQIEKALGALR